MRRFAIIILISFLSVPAVMTAASRVDPPVYELSVSIEPTSGSMTVRGSVEFPLLPSASDFKFNLHETFVITKLTVDGEEAKFSYAPMEGQLPLPASRGVVVELPKGFVGSRIQMNIEYGGTLKVLPEFNASPDLRHSLDDQVNSRMVELAGYSSWYPQFIFGNAINVSLTVSLPQNWTPICSGTEISRSVKGNRMITRWSSPKDMDILILASPEYRKRSLDAAGVHVEIYDTQLPEHFLTKDGAQIASVLKLYSTTLGDANIPGGTVKHVYSPKRKGQGKAGIARPGLIVTSEGLTLDSLARDPKFSLFQGIAHELGHYWWNFGIEQGDWVNEAFAEYFSAIAVQKISSEEEFRAVMSDYRNQVAALPSDAPSVATVPQWGNFVVRYYKGALMLDELRQTMGDEKFFQAAREFYQTHTGRPTSTADFRAFWTAKLGGQSKLLDAWLNSTGGTLPDRVATKTIE